MKLKYFNSHVTKIVPILGQNFILPKVWRGIARLVSADLCEPVLT
jgi:hypothetical protein